MNIPELCECGAYASVLVPTTGEFVCRDCAATLRADYNEGEV